MRPVSFCISAMIFAATTAFAASPPPKKKECRPQGEPLTQCTPAYNAPAEINVASTHWLGSNVATFFDASFTYWYAGQEGLKIASNGVSNGGVFYFAPVTHTFTQSFDYKPGFKVGAGIVVNHEWTIRAGYTWFRGKNVDHSETLSGISPTAGTAVPASGTNVWVVDDWFLQGTTNGQALSGSKVSSSWHLALDLIDAVLERPFYQGRRHVVSPFAGLRAALIRQSVNVELTESAGLFPSLSPQPIGSRNHSNSWAIGPRAGCNSRYLFSSGFRIAADVAASLLYTKYTSIKHREDRASPSFNTGPYQASLNNYSCLRPAAELGLGLGWGTYCANRAYHFDLALDYDFTIFWSQNMIRKLLDDTLTGTSPSAADLFLHGLTVTGRFDF